MVKFRSKFQIQIFSQFYRTAEKVSKAKLVMVIVKSLGKYDHLLNLHMLVIILLFHDWDSSTLNILKLKEVNSPHKKWSLPFIACSQYNNLKISKPIRSYKSHKYDNHDMYFPRYEAPGDLRVEYVKKVVPNIGWVMLLPR